jgi:hypothetical protein
MEANRAGAARAITAPLEETHVRRPGKLLLAAPLRVPAALFVLG